MLQTLKKKKQRRKFQRMKLDSATEQRLQKKAAGAAPYERKPHPAGSYVPVPGRLTFGESYSVARLKELIGYLNNPRCSGHVYASL